MENEKLRKRLIAIGVSYADLYSKYEKIEEKLSEIKKERDKLSEELITFKNLETGLKENYIKDGGTEEEFNLVYKDVVNAILSKKYDL